MTAIKSKFHLNNRSDIRAFKKEATRAAEFLQHIIDDFVDALFDAPKKVNYRTIYLHFLDLWNATIKHLKTKVKPRLKKIRIDETFFAVNYAPALLLQIP